MKTTRFLRVMMMFSLLSLCLLCLCSAAVSVEDVSSTVGPQVTLTAKVTDMTATSYQWYKCDDANGTNPDIITDATKASYTTDYLDKAGTWYYKVVVNGTDSDVASVTATMPTEPVVFKFNNAADLALWSPNGSGKALANIDGKTVFTYLAPATGNGDGHTTIKATEEGLNFYLQGYPYVAVSSSYPNYESNTLDIYICNDREYPDGPPNSWTFASAYTGMPVACNKGFVTTILNTATGKFECYADGKVVTQGTAGGDGIGGADKWKGKINTFRVDVSNGSQNLGAQSYVEYVGFFPTKEAALAYNGEMPEDAAAKPVIDAIEKAEADGKLVLNFCDAETQQSAVAAAKKLIEDVAAAAVEELKADYNTVEFSIANEVYSRPSPYSAGTYTVDAQVLIGDIPFRRSLVSTSVTVELKAKPDALVVKFDSQETVTAAGVYKNAGTVATSFVAKGTTLTGNTTAEDRSFMRIVASHETGGNTEVCYNNFAKQTGNTFNYAEYPYMKISYRRNVPSSVTGEAMMIYTAENNPSYFIYRAGTDNPVWEQFVVDMRDAGVSNAVAFYADGAANPSSYGSLTKGGDKYVWNEAVMKDGESPVKIRMTRYKPDERTVDFEYIAFFASEDEARMYPQPLPENAEYDVETLTKKNTFEATGVITQAQAEAAADKYLKGFVFATKYNIDTANAVFTAPSSAEAGSYVFDVWFGTEREEKYTVKVTMTLPKLPKPVVMYTDSLTTLQSLSASNATLRLEDGVIKMQVNNPSKDDGFWLVGNIPGCMDSFKVTTLPYLKMRYKLDGITVDTNGNPKAPTSSKFQLFFWMKDPAYPGLKDIANYRVFYPYTSSFEDGDEIEVIVDISHITNANKGEQPRVWVRNLTKNEKDYTVVGIAQLRNESDGTDKTFVRTENTTITSIRLNLVRESNLDRSAEFVYAGFFPSLDEAKKFDSSNRLAEASSALRAAAENAEVIWGDIAKEKTSIPDSQASFNADGSYDISGIKTQTVTAMRGIRTWVSDVIGTDGTVKINSYTPATATTKGSVNFDITLESGYKTTTVEDITLKFSEKPQDYIMWRFNSPEMLSKINVFSPTASKIEDNLLKLEHTDQYNPSNFTISLKPEAIGKGGFLLQNYSYMLIKYRRLYETSAVSFIFANADGTQGSTSQMGLGWHADQWYYSLMDANVRDKVTPWLYNYNIETDTLEKNYVDPKLGAPSAPNFRGPAQTFTMQLGSFRYSRRGAEIEYIAFFPSMEDAKNYVENLEAWDDIVSDTTVNLKDYTSDTVTYYDGNTQAVAEAKAKALIAQKSAAEGVTVTINTVSYTAPVMDTTDGVLTYTATVTKDNKTVYTTDEISMTIGKAADAGRVVYRFTNPDFVKDIEGAVVYEEFASVKTENGTLTFKTDATKPNVAPYDAVVYGDFEGGYAVEYDQEYADEIVITFEDKNAIVRGVCFSENDFGYEYDIPEALLAAVERFNKSHSYTEVDNSKTIADAKSYTRRIYLDQTIADENVSVANIRYDDYIPSTEEDNGSISVAAKLAYGDKFDTYYEDVYFTVELAKDTDKLTATPKSEGHEFLGYDTITASKAFTSVPKTLEFSIKVASDKLSGSMDILKNGTVIAKVSNGKISVGGITAATALTADTWTHVAVTTDGKLYINGTLSTTGSAFNLSTTAPVIGESFTGHLMNVRFWSDIRTDAEISANKTTLSDMEGLLAEWKLTADSYKWLEYKDSSANNNTAIFKSTGWYKMEAGMQGDYSIIQFGDTQSYFTSAPYSYNRIPDMFKWMADNKEKYNIGYVTLLGDATQVNTWFEWDVVREAFRYLDNSNIPYAIPLGNHDYPSPSSGVGAELRDSTKFQEAFNYYDYINTFGEENVGTFEDAPDLTNMYGLATIGGTDYIFFSLEYGPRDAVLEWVGETLNKYPERKAVISTHCYFEMNGTLSTYNSTTNAAFSDGNEGIDIYNKIVTKYPNVVLVTCGHSQGDDTKQHPHNRGDKYEDSPTGDDFGGDVVQILSDCSAYALNYPTNEVAFGADEGLIFMMMFEDGGKTMHTYVYSPLHDAFFRSVNEQTHTIKDISVQPTLTTIGTELREENGEIPEGMRFKMSLSKSYENFEDDIEIMGYGMVLTPDDIIPEGAQLTEDMFDGTDYEGYVMVEECSDRIYYEDDNRIDFTVVVHSIPDTEFALSRKITARGYVDYKVNGGEIQRLYTNKTLTCSMNDLLGK